jgi:hypothetical protein
VGERLRHRLERGLGGRVARAPEGGQRRRARRDVHDAPAARRRHARREVVDEVERAVHVHVDAEAPALRRVLERGLGRRERGVVHDEVRAPERLVHLVGELRDRDLVADVERHGERTCALLARERGRLVDRAR